MDCNSGEVATGGGVVFTSGDVNSLLVVESKPNPQDNDQIPRGWTIRVRSTVNQNYSYNVIAICAPSLPTRRRRRRR